MSFHELGNICAACGVLDCNENAIKLLRESICKFLHDVIVKSSVITQYKSALTISIEDINETIYLLSSRLANQAVGFESLEGSEDEWASGSVSSSEDTDLVSETSSISEEDISPRKTTNIVHGDPQLSSLCLIDDENSRESIVQLCDMDVGFKMSERSFYTLTLEALPSKGDFCPYIYLNAFKELFQFTVDQIKLSCYGQEWYIDNNIALLHITA
jgi:hypothetical protein